YGNLLGLGVPHLQAMIAHGVSAALALIVAFLTIRRGDPRLQGAALCAATALASPYLFFYDTTLLAVAAALIGAPRKWWEWPALILGWGSGLSVGLSFLLQALHWPAFPPLAPIAAWTVLLTAAARSGVFTLSGNAALRPAPAPQP